MSVTITLPARARAQLTATGIHVTRGGHPVLRDLDLTVSPGSRIGVVGENGRGKSTLLRILAARLPADSGEIRLTGTIGTADQEIPPLGTVGDLIDQELAVVHAVLHAVEQTGSPEAIDAADILDAWNADRRLRIALQALNAITDRTRPLTELSVGQRYRIRLACLLGAGHDFLLLDEPTNHLDASGLEFLTARLNDHPGGIVLVSHDRALLTDVATSIVDLDPSRDGKPRVYGGGYPGYLTGRTAERRRWSDEYDRQQAEHQRLSRDLDTARSRLSTGWRPDKGTGRHQRATRAPALVQAVHRRREDLAAVTLAAPSPPPQFNFPMGTPKAFHFATTDLHVPGRLDHPGSISLTPGSRLVVTGPNGAGKSTLLRLLAARGGGTLLAQESPPPPAGKTARDLHGDFPADLGLLTESDWDRPIATLSTGQQRRLDLAVLLTSLPDILLLDEPTNHLSITLVDELTEALQTTRAAVVLATHDRQLLRDTVGWPRLELG
ncbi:macrolide transport system ATP-binding/permease protein [Actinoplanes lutulentus]|uniref:Macrolide transport system ATP-binding/permease protein n=1 Tax=Actinoplanes lutulentus TaxID=1287878 RepID=A0A327Z6G3_9ACTN|nr:ATP-binding cassette domain-containing protein [Actinoplanes lutulentus]MBB2948166.1 macrolide transport system ATP-binding/permease protein [Actinoplanes lutulentus]RAK31334.1 macrolide transport system ATP-binding/permease protein [Actinoplanes lutulentus]